MNNSFSIRIMKGRIFKLRLNAKNIDGDMDNFLFNKVQNRDNTHIYLSKGRVKNYDLDIDDYIFIQSEGKITHYMKVRQRGPFLREGDEESQISVKDINKVEPSFKSDFKGQGYNKLEHFEVISLLQKLTI